MTTKDRDELLKAEARRIIEAAGVDVREQISLRKYVPELRAASNCREQTALNYLAQAVRLMRGDLSSARRAGRPALPPREKKKQRSVTLSPAVWDFVRGRALVDQSDNEVIESLIRSHPDWNGQ